MDGSTQTQGISASRDVMVDVVDCMGKGLGRTNWAWRHEQNKRLDGSTKPTINEVMTLHLQARGRCVGKSIKHRAPVLGTKQSLGTLIEKTTRVGWLKSFILHISGRATLILWISGQSQKTTQAPIGWLETWFSVLRDGAQGFSGSLEMSPPPSNTPTASNIGLKRWEAKEMAKMKKTRHHLK
jgi:hypothetical protein